MKTHLLFLLLAAGACFAADPVTFVRDLPPSPFDTNAMAARVPQPNRVLRDIEARLDLRVAGTNGAEVSLLDEIKRLKAARDTLEAAAYAKDPLLRVYGQYEGQAHEWVVKHHQRELNAASRYSRSAGPDARPPAVSPQRLNDLVNMAVYTELAAHTNFAPLLKGGFTPVARLIGDTYARHDAWLGFKGATPSAAVPGFETYVAEFGRRYDLVKAKLAEIQRAESMPDEALAGLVYGTLYRILDGCALTYVQAHTPGELTRVRAQLRSKYNELARLRAG